MAAFCFMARPAPALFLCRMPAYRRNTAGSAVRYTMATAMAPGLDNIFSGGMSSTPIPKNLSSRPPDVDAFSSMHYMIPFIPPVISATYPFLVLSA